jgi:hypothetical protein
MGAIFRYILSNIGSLWKLFGFYRRFKRLAKLFETKPKVVSVDAVLSLSTDCNCKKQ